MDIDLVEELDFTAQWRRDKAAQYPKDTRNTEAAELLERLAIEVGKLSKSFLVRRLEKIDDELVAIDGWDFRLSEDLSDYRRSIGFHRFPESGEKYLSDLIEIYSNHIERVGPGSDIEEQKRASRDLQKLFGCVS